MKLFLALLTIVKVHAQRSGQACECPTTHDGAADSPEASCPDLIQLSVFRAAAPVS